MVVFCRGFVYAMLDRTSMVAALREESVFITNILKFLPPELSSGYGGDSDDSDHATGGNRALSEPSDEHHEQLRAKLKTKLSSLKEKNGSMSTQKRLRQRLSRLEKKGGGGAAAATAEKRTNQKRTGGSRQNNARINAVKCDKKQKMIARRGEKALSAAKKPIYNSDGKLVFSKFDFAHEAAAVTPYDSTSSRAGGGLSARLARARHLQQQQQVGGQGGAEQQWSAALQKADGQKLRDDPQLLARSLRRRRQNRARSQRTWQARVARQSGEQSDKQQKRAANIQQRKEAKQGRRLQKMKKKGRIIPGF